MSRRGAVSPRGARDLDAVVPYRVYQANRLLRTHLMRFLDEYADGVSPEQWFILQRLAERAPRRQVELADPALRDAPNVTRLVDALIDRGLVQRNADPDDRRSWLVSLTAAGRKLISRSWPEVVAARRELYDGIRDDEIELFLTLLDRLETNTRALLA